MTYLLMTATIAPPAKAVNLRRVDVQSRVADYRNALRYNLGLIRDGAISRIVFVDNSNFGVQDLEDVAREQGFADRVHCLSFDGNHGAEIFERLYLELRLMRHAVENVPCLRDADGARVWKVTGRYRVRNLRRILASTPEDVDLVVHCRNRPIPFVEFPVAGFRTSSMRQILDTALAEETIKLGGEGALRALLEKGAYYEFKVMRRLPHVPLYSGRRGHDGANYDGLRYRLKHFVRATSNRLFPALWL